MKSSIRHAAGNVLVVGLGGPELTGLERAWLRIVRPGGVILFKRNIVDAEQTLTLLEEATGLGQPGGLRCVDIEGGTVNRLRDALGPLPSAQAVAAAARNRRKPGLARQHGEIIARAARAFGFNTTLAPVFDLALPESAEVMGSRLAGASAADVIAYAAPFFQGLASVGIAGCAKHFPGLGGGAADTHLLTASISRTWDQLWREDLLPYRELHRKIPLIMVNHAAYPATRGKDIPASVSSFWITNVLRKRIGYHGIIFSDDFEMGGILKYLDIEAATIAAIRAGMDAIEICHSPELILRGYEALVTEAERSASFRKLLLARSFELSVKRMLLPAKRHGRPLTGAQLEALRDRVLRFNETMAAGEDESRSRRATNVENS